MGRVAVREAIQQTVQNAGVDYVGTVFEARPVIAGEEAYVETMNGQAIQESANGSACVVVVNMPDDDRTRFGDVGRGAVADFDKHLIALELFFASTSGKGIASQKDYDHVVDELTTLIRQNPNMSAPAVVWSAGEYRYGVKHSMAQPYTSEDGLTILINGVVRFEAWEQYMGSFS